MRPQSNTIFVVAGESSGDREAAHLIQEIKKRMPELNFVGLGGHHMKETGVEILHDLIRLAVIGLWEVIRKYIPIRRIFDDAVRYIDKEKPRAVLLVDYPGFNLRLAKKIKKTGVPVIYYISPQIWAWGKQRTQMIANVVDFMMTLFPFEPAVYSETNLKVEFVGHSLRDRVKPSHPREQLRQEFGLNSPSIVLACGSRVNEVKKILPVMLASAELILKDIPEAQFILAESPTITEELYNRYLPKYAHLPIQRIRNRLYDVATASDAAMVASGTATLETALCGTPFIVLYKVTWSTYWLGRLLIQIPYIGLANVVAGKKVAPEYIQHDATPEKVSREMIHLIQHPERQQRIKKMLNAIKVKLGPGQAEERAAEAFVKFLQNNQTPAEHITA